MNLQCSLVVCVRVNTWRSRVWCWWSQSVSVRRSSPHTRTCQLAPPSEMGCSSHCCLLFLLSQSPWNVQKNTLLNCMVLKTRKRTHFYFSVNIGEWIYPQKDSELFLSVRVYIAGNKVRKLDSKQIIKSNLKYAVLEPKTCGGLLVWEIKNIL